MQSNRGDESEILLSRKLSCYIRDPHGLREVRRGKLTQDAPSLTWHL